VLAHLALTALAMADPAGPERLLDLVRPIVGTARKDQRIGAANSGQTFPAVGVPFGMTHWTPQTQASEDKCVSPFHAQDERILGIRASHWWSGSCTHDYGSVTIAAITGPLYDRPAVRSEGEMQAQRLVELRQQGRRELAHPAADPLDRNGSDLLRVSLRIAGQPTLRRREKHLKRIDSTHVGGDRHGGDDTPVEALCRAIGPIVADDHRRPSLVRLRAARRIDIDHPNLSPQHQRAGSIPSPATASQASASPPVAHSSQACA